MKYRNPQYTDTGLINVEIEHPIHGWIPFTVDPEDTEAEFNVKALDKHIRANDQIEKYKKGKRRPKENLSKTLDHLFEFDLNAKINLEIWKKLHPSLSDTEVTKDLKTLYMKHYK